jgi:hypothetical protein
MKQPLAAAATAWQQESLLLAPTPALLHVFTSFNHGNLLRTINK